VVNTRLHQEKYKFKHTNLTPKVLQWPNFGHCYFGHVAVIRRCDMIFGNFMVSRKLKGLFVKLKNARFGHLL
jgi:hypothetical protein